MGTHNLIQAGIAALQQGQVSRAQSHFANAVALNPRSELAWLWLGRIAAEPDRRAYYYRQVLRLNPRNAEAKRILQSALENTALARKNPELSRARKQLVKPSYPKKPRTAKLSRVKKKQPARLSRDHEPQPVITLASPPYSVRAAATASLDHSRNARAYPALFGPSVLALIAIVLLFLLMQGTEVNRFVQGVALAPTAQFPSSIATSSRPERTATPPSVLSLTLDAIEVKSTRAPGDLFAQAEKYLSGDNPQMVLELLLPKLNQLSEKRDLVEAYYYLGRAELGLKHYRSAAGYFKQLQSIEPSVEYLFMLAVTYDMDGDLNNALESYTLLAQWNGKDALIHRPLAERRIKEITQRIGTPTPGAR